MFSDHEVLYINKNVAISNNLSIPLYALFFIIVGDAMRWKATVLCISSILFLVSSLAVVFNLQNIKNKVKKMRDLHFALNGQVESVFIASTSLYLP